MLAGVVAQHSEYPLPRVMHIERCAVVAGGLFLEHDAHETDNLHDRQRSTADALKGVLERISGGQGAMNVGALDREALEKLAALGYVGATAQTHTGSEPSRVDPKDFIQVFNRLRQANSAVRDRRFKEALPILVPGLQRIAESVRAMTLDAAELPLHLAGGALMIPGAGDVIARYLGRTVRTYPHALLITPIGIARSAA